MSQFCAQAPVLPPECPFAGVFLLYQKAQKSPGVQAGDE